jgi:hypothetical protein
MASRRAAEKDGWWPRFCRGGGTRALPCGDMVSAAVGGGLAGREGWESSAEDSVSGGGGESFVRAEVFASRGV